jgi:isopentenyl-diphosphate Delta-isomerase
MPPHAPGCEACSQRRIWYSRHQRQLVVEKQTTVSSGLPKTSTDDPDELFDLIDANDHVIGQVRRAEAHRNPALLHRSVQVLVFDTSNRLLLQRRSATKDLFPGYFCASASGHVASGDDYVATAAREVAEELGIHPRLTYLAQAIVRSTYETELTVLFAARSQGPFWFDPAETDGGEFVMLDELFGDLGARLPMTPALHEALRELERRQHAGTLLDLLTAL